jgi:hypothetical protein
VKNCKLRARMEIAEIIGKFDFGLFRKIWFWIVCEAFEIYTVLNQYGKCLLNKLCAVHSDYVSWSVYVMVTYVVATHSSLNLIPCCSLSLSVSDNFDSQHLPLELTFTLHNRFHSHTTKVKKKEALHKFVCDSHEQQYKDEHQFVHFQVEWGWNMWTS